MIVAFLQNQWFKNPARVKSMMDRNPDAREWYIRKFLFMGCLTGRRLRATFGDLVDGIIWEETSREIGGTSSSVFTPDANHIHQVLQKHTPVAVLAFGKVAREGLQLAECRVRIIGGPHPAARYRTVMDELRAMAKQIAL